MRNTFIILLLSIGLKLRSQIPVKLIFNDTLISINDSVIFNHYSYKVLYSKDIYQTFKKTKINKYKIKSSLYDRNFKWYILSELGVSFEIGSKNGYVDLIRINFNQDELISNKIRDVSSFNGSIDFYGYKIDKNTTLGELKTQAKIDVPKCKEEIRYLMSSTGDLVYNFYFTGHADNSTLTMIMIQVPDYLKYKKANLKHKNTNHK